MLAKEIMLAKEGKQYICTENVYMDDGELAYIEGNIYPCENEGCITDEQGDDFHLWQHPEKYFTEL